MDKVRSNEKIDNVGALVLNDNKLTKINLKDFSVSISKNYIEDFTDDITMFSDNDEIRIFVDQ